MVRSLNVEPFSLGLPGEMWDKRLEALLIPLPSFNEGGRIYAMVAQETNGYAVYSTYFEDRFLIVDSALMAAALVHGILESYLHGNETKPD